MPVFNYVSIFLAACRYIVFIYLSLHPLVVSWMYITCLHPISPFSGILFCSTLPFNSLFTSFWCLHVSLHLSALSSLPLAFPVSDRCRAGKEKGEGEKERRYREKEREEERVRGEAWCFAALVFSRKVSPLSTV